MSAGFDRYFQFMYSYIKILVYMGGYYEQFRGFRTLFSGLFLFKNTIKHLL